MKYVGIDGDDVGARLELGFLKNREEDVRLLSKEVDKSILIMSENLQSLGMEVIFFSGDSLLCKGEDLDTNMLVELIESQSITFNFSAGIGNTLRDTYLALKYAKTSGKSRVVIFEDSEYKVLKIN
ncbi:mCpol domain-containing protein [Leptolyngbya sp. KIOST-1]|uniref:mCpol domain-containing protein n=1 Tax=Leptolyngbya sp. KIOST-1 TaxID=1229172 RepID=UPI0005690E11|nr:mCpol domain-containing protein [Leptolyngbya sp. KIOST-1]